MSNHPNYHKGFYDAQSGQPLFDDADPIYAEGWRGYWIVREGVKKLAKAPGSGSGGNVRSSFG
jgi:hypothetical protein